MKIKSKKAIVFILGLCMCVGITYAVSQKVEITIEYSGINIVIDGEQINPKDANGKTVEPFVYNGTTYLPVRAVGEALGKTVEWDNATNTVYLGEKPTPPAPNTSVLLDQDGIKITYIGIDVDGRISTDIDVLIENNSGRDVIVQVRDLSINGFMITPIFSSNVTNGNKINDNISIMKSYLTDNGITDIKDIQLSFNISDPTTFETITKTNPISFTIK